MTVNRDQAHSGTALGHEVNALRFVGIDIGKAAYPSAVALLADWKAERLYRIAEMMRLIAEAGCAVRTCSGGSPLL